MDIKPIETEYKSCLFRSRLEARWAVFFDALGIEWEYEPEGYVLSDGTWYLPDFWLPTQELWVEIKPSHFWPENHSRENAAIPEVLHYIDLSKHKRQDFLLLCGQPGWKEGADGRYDYLTASYNGILFTAMESLRSMGDNIEFFLGLASLHDFLRDKPQYAPPTSVFSHTLDESLQLIELDSKYYRDRYGREHHRWKYPYPHLERMAWYERDLPYSSLSNRIDINSLYGGWTEFEFTPALQQAYTAARSARFER